MTLIAPVVDTTVNVPFRLLTGDRVFIAEGIDLVSTSVSGLFHIGTAQLSVVSDVEIEVLGRIAASQGIAIESVAFGGRDIGVRIGDTGSVAGTAHAINLEGNRLSVDNAGQVFSSQTTVVLRTTFNVFDTDPTPEEATILNSGEIIGTTAIQLVGLGTFSITNTGTLQGTAAIDADGGASRASVINSGTITGTVDLGDAADLFDNRGGLVNGRVDLGAGDDTYVAAGAGVEVVQGGAGIDVLDLRHLGAATLVIFGNGVNAGSIAGDSLTGFEVVLASDSGDDLIIGLPGAVRIEGNGGNDTLAGLGNSDTLIGGDGDDSLIGGGGADSLVGGSGNDTYEISDAAFETDLSPPVIVEAAGGGTDTVLTQISYEMDDHLEIGRIVVALSLALTGNALDNQLFGHDRDDTLTGGAGDDLLDGGAGANLLQGDSGNDTYVIGAAGSTIVEAAGEGVDTVQTAVTHTLAAHVENGQITVTAGRALTGNSLNNVLTGNAGADTLSGGDGADRLDGQGGVDLMLGGAGNDIYVVDRAEDLVVEGIGGGVDRVLTSVDVRLASEVEEARITATAGRAVTGNGLANVIEGGAGGDRIGGLGGADRLLGGAGDDRLNGGAGIDRLLGGGGRDQLTGGGGNDRLQGGGGADRINGGAGRDDLRGGAGADSFVFLSLRQSGDRIADFTGADRIEIRVAGFGGGLERGVLEADQFTQGRSNRAADADDRFIFRTTDRTLWFDADGQGGAAARLVADLQPGAVLTAGDILLV